MNRQVNIFKNYPNTVNKIKDFIELAKAQTPEFTLANNNLCKSLNNQFILYTDKDGIKRFEQLTGISADIDESIEQRRFNVLEKWNNELPYTLNRAKERLNALIGSESYTLEIEHDLYMLYLTVHEKPIGVLRSVLNVMKDMTPCNMIINFTGDYQNSFTEDIEVENKLRMISEFYPRYNLEHLILNGDSYIDGRYFLDGYKTDVKIDFYPSNVMLKSFIEVKKEIFPALKQENSCNVQIAEESKEIKLISKLVENVKSNEEIKIKNEVLNNISCFTANSILSDFENTIETKSINKLKSSSEHESEYFSNAKLKCDANEKIQTNSSLIIEKHLWFMDGKFELNGEKPLDPEIIYY